MRYQSDLLYTYSGLFLVTVNPYCPLPIYSTSTSTCTGSGQETPSPTPYAMADEAFRNSR